MPKDKAAWDGCNEEAVAEELKPGHLTPTTRRACDVAGVDAIDLLPITKSEFKER